MGPAAIAGEVGEFRGERELIAELRALAFPPNGHA
jgi:hypothetical protein